MALPKHFPDKQERRARRDLRLPSVCRQKYAAACTNSVPNATLALQGKPSTNPQHTRKVPMPELTAEQAAVEDATTLLLEDLHKPGREDGERWDEAKFEAFGRLIGYLFPDEAWRTTPHVNNLLTELGYIYQ